MIALFGGSFDPIHLGHLDFARRALAHYGFEAIYFVPANRNPLKGGAAAPAEQRVEMLRRALHEAGETRFVLDDDEAHANGPSYTIFTVEKYRALKAKPIALLLGNEVFHQIDQWHRPKDILQLASVVVATRDSSPLDIAAVLKSVGIHDGAPAEGHPGRLTHSGGSQWIEPFAFPSLPISATAIREAAARDSQTMPPGIQRTVWQFIQENRLYTVK